jgi:acetylornithine deacetylase/succinyl-diaminopimelate desuccinylase-like protein
MQLDPVLNHIEFNSEHFIQRVMEYVRHPSISAHGQGIAEVGDLLVGMLDGLGFGARKVATAGHPVVLGKWMKAPGKKTVLIYGHYDVQPADPLDKWISPPFEPTIRNGRIYARGIGDNKGQHFANLMAIESLLAVYGTLPCNVLFVLEGEEEIGSPRMAEFVRANAAELACDLVITSDGPLHASGAPVISYGVRGIIGFDLTAREANSDLHSGNFGGVVPNAIWTLVHLLGTMKNADGEITIDGLDAPVQPAGPAEIAAMAALPDISATIKQELNLRQFDEPVNRSFYERTMFRPTLTINGLHAGYSGPGSKTVLPCEATAKCDIRLVENMTAAHAQACVQAHVRKFAPHVEVNFGNSMEPSRVPVDGWYTPPLRKAIIAATGIEPLLIPSAGGSLPEYVWTKILGVPALTLPYANADEANHAPNENLDLNLFIRGIKTGAAMLCTLADA